MAGLRGSHRAHFVAAWALCGLELLCMAATAPPLRWMAPAWLWAPAMVAVALVFGAALVRSWSVPFRRRGNGFDVLRSVRPLPRGAKLGYPLAACLIAVGLATAGNAGEVGKDASRYYGTTRRVDDHGRTSVRAEISRAEYDRHRAAEVRIATGVPAVFAVLGSLLVLAAAGAASGAADDPRSGRRRR